MRESRQWTNHAGGYWVCHHCSKKANPHIPGHDCCGRCRLGREHLRAAQINYAGPGSFAHDYWEVWLRPGLCNACGEPRAAHQP